MKVLVVGASGLVGSYLMKEFAPRYDTVGTYHHHPPRGTAGLLPFDITDPASVHTFVSRMQPDVILLAAAQPDVECCEERPEETYQTNVRGTYNVARAAYKERAKIVFYSTDYVFDGKNPPYYEDSEPCPINVYGRQKLEAEYMITQIGGIVIRTSGVYGRGPAEGKNFALRVIREASARRVVKAPTDQYLSPTYAKNLASITRALVERGESGVFHACGGAISRYDFAVAVATVFSLDLSLIKPVSSDEMEQKAPRPKAPVMETRKLDGMGVYVEDYIWGLYAMMKEMCG